MMKRNSIHNTSQDIPVDPHFVIVLSYLTLLVCEEYVSKFLHFKMENKCVTVSTWNVCHK